MAAPLFSVIVPAYGRPTLLAAALDSVLGQSEPDFECIVVADGDPNPVEVPDDPRVRLVRRETNGGSAAARNTGIEEARGRFVVFLDDDDVYAPDRLAFAREGHERAPVVICWGHYLGGVRRPGRILDGDVSDALLRGFAPNMGQTSVARDALLRFDERLRSAEDVEWWVRTVQTHEVATVPEFGLYYRRHDGPRRQKAPVVRAESRLTVVEWHREYFAAHPEARAFQLRRAALLYAKAGERRAARRTFARSFRAHPKLSVLAHMVVPPRAPEVVPDPL